MGLGESPDSKEYAEVIVAKNRNGAVMTPPCRHTIRSGGDGIRCAENRMEAG